MPKGSSPFQQQFMAYLQGADASHLAPWLQNDPVLWRRLQIYRNSSMKATVQALADNFPVSGSVLAGKQFRELARDYVLAHRPTHSLLAWYGQQFPAWLEAQLARHQCPWLSELARLERCWLNSVLAEDQLAVSAEDIAALVNDGLDIQMLQLGLHPSAQLLETRFDVWDLWLQKRDDLNQPNHAPVFLSPGRRLLWRHSNHELQYRVLSAAEWVFIAELSQHHGLEQAATAALTVDEEFDVSDSFAGLLNQGLLCLTSANKGVI
ncbi:DNA-binding domain-containing protein [Arsukibacterium sp.]|uniref:DNA-binding domain-containing protein n=1 Tax=Arsukibacterium sp. TaxID=1977258 RepID=UPI002FDAFD47